GACSSGARPDRSASRPSPASWPTSSPPRCREALRVRLLRFLAERRAELALLVGQHVLLVLVSAAIAVAVGVPVGIALARRPRLARPVLALANLAQTIPSLALFGFLIPVPFIGGIGVRTAIVALVLYALLPILRNTCTGIQQVDPAVLEAATGMGMTGGQRLRLVELPL